jgi:hypothetical protein
VLTVLVIRALLRAARDLPVGGTLHLSAGLCWELLPMDAVRDGRSGEDVRA